METLYKYITALVFVAWFLGMVFLETGGAIHLFLGIGIFTLAKSHTFAQAQKMRQNTRKPLLLGNPNPVQSNATALEAAFAYLDAAMGHLAPEEVELSTSITLQASCAEEATCEILHETAVKDAEILQPEKAPKSCMAKSLKSIANSMPTLSATWLEIRSLICQVQATDSLQPMEISVMLCNCVNTSEMPDELQTSIANSGLEREPLEYHFLHKYPRSFYQHILCLKGWSLAKRYRYHPTFFDPISPGSGALPGA